jgi:hypothetical protein
MDKDSRILQLNLLLQYCSFKYGIFTSGERICINQERAYLLSLNTEKPLLIKVFDYSKKLEFKMNSTLEKINTLNWKPKEEIEINWCLNID